jgi:hypothetical protein
METPSTPGWRGTLKAYNYTDLVGITKNQRKKERKGKEIKLSDSIEINPLTGSGTCGTSVGLFSKVPHVITLCKSNS